MKAVLAGLCFWAAALTAAPPSDFRMVRVVTRNAVVFSEADLQSPQKGRVWFRAAFQLLDDEPVNGFWKILYTDREAYIRSSDSRREAGQGDPSFQAGADAAGASPTAQSPRELLSARIVGAPDPAGPAENEGQERLLNLPPKKPVPTPETSVADPVALEGTAATVGRKNAVRDGGPVWAPETAPKWMFYVPLLWGLGGASTPAFRPAAASDSTRPLRDAFGWGLGMEARLKPWAAIYGEWTHNRHHTPAADRGLAALPVGLSSTAAYTFAQGDLDYVMQAHVISLGVRLGHYWAPLMPWVSLGLTEQLWDASYWHGSNIQGSARGAATALEAGVGLDIYFKLFGAGVAKLTPTLGFITPLASAAIEDVGGSGLRWPDADGTPIRAPLRAGIHLGIGF